MGRDRANNGNIVAMKKIKLPLAAGGVPMTTLREIAILKQLSYLKHPNIIKYELITFHIILLNILLYYFLFYC